MSISLISASEKTAESDELLDKEETAKTYSIISLFTSGMWMAFVSINVAVQFIVIVMVYYGLSFAVGTLPGFGSFSY